MALQDRSARLGRLYWNAVLPIHALMFGGLLRQIAQRAERVNGRDTRQ